MDVSAIPFNPHLGLAVGEMEPMLIVSRFLPLLGDRPS